MTTYRCVKHGVRPHGVGKTGYPAAIRGLKPAATDRLPLRGESGLSPRKKLWDLVVT